MNKKMNKEKSSDKMGEHLRRITADLKLYIEKRLELMMLNTGEYVSGWIAASVQRVGGALILLGGIGFLLFALAIYLGELLGSESLGYVLVSLPLLVIGMLFISLKPKGLFERLQQNFEAEVIKVINQNSEVKKKKLELKDTVDKTEQKER